MGYPTQGTDGDPIEMGEAGYFGGPTLPSVAYGPLRGAVLGIVREVFGERLAARLAAGTIVFIVAFSFIGPLLYRTSQGTVNLAASSLHPSLAHPLGTDEVGYDELGRLMLAGQTSLEVALAAALLATAFGVLYGATAAYAGGWVDSVMMRFVDGVLAIPALFLLLVLATIVVPTVPLLILVIALISWLTPSRLVRGEALSLRTREYIQAVTCMGGGARRILVHHIIPNTIGTIMVNAAFQVADAILLLAYLGFLGLGVPPPATNWGELLSEGINYTYAGAWWLIVPPGACIVLTVVSFNYLGDALRDYFDVRLKIR